MKHTYFRNIVDHSHYQENARTTTFAANKESCVFSQAIELESLLCRRVFCLPWNNKFIPWVMGFFFSRLVGNSSVLFFTLSSLLILFFLFMDDLTKNWDCLTLSDRKGLGCCLTDDLQSQDYITAVKFSTKRALNIDAIAKTFNHLWRMRNSFEVQNQGEHKVIFIFEDSADMNRVLMSEPWSFGNHLIVMLRYEKDSPLTDLNFKKATFQVQVHNIPICYMNVAVA